MLATCTKLTALWLHLFHWFGADLQRPAQCSFEALFSFFLSVFTTGLFFSHDQSKITACEHATAIGYLSIEVAKLETVLADLVGILLDISVVYSNIIYFTPRAAIARVELVTNLARVVLDGYPKLKTEAEKVATKANSVLGKRNEIMHAGWMTGEADTVLRVHLRLGAKPDQPVTASELKSLIAEAETLVERVYTLIYDLDDALRVSSWVRKLPHDEDAPCAHADCLCPATDGSCASFIRSNSSGPSSS